MALNLTVLGLLHRRYANERSRDSREGLSKSLYRATAWFWSAIGLALIAFAVCAVWLAW